MTSHVETTFSITEAEYLEGQKLYTRVKQRRIYWTRYILIGVFLCSVVTVLFTAPISSLQEKPSIAVFPLSILVFLLISPWLQRQTLKKRFKIEGPMLENISVRVDDYGVSGLSGSGQGQLAWKAFDGYVEGPNIFATFRGFTFSPIPKRTLSANDQQRLAAILAAHLPRMNKYTPPRNQR